MDPKVDRGARISMTETFYDTGQWKVDTLTEFRPTYYMLRWGEEGS